ncbi:MAG: hypothetical protein JRM74_02760 [Nitrososphaerota archaeon]|jgi:hypothetical protein|nr:hypothetical protein [Nitrososphaerota archaeon]MDG6953219.1 hypothetical protein [Nitrososphaerota archaeon]MDG6957394.1 hypothetical protein [Nitrososphaerota archaeon]MDG6960387.1 hypothetical protein [Nitrososphaerota archaeon]MDG6972638.1 hypothetical protein [Nitrososphaerota archaeon]
MTVVGQEVDSTNVRTVQLVKLLSEVGPNVPEISRRLGQFKESVRYRYKEKIVKRGIAIQAAVDHERLGLRRMMAVADVSEPYRGYAQAVFAAMHELCYVVGFAKTLVSGEHVVNFSVPAEHVSAVRGLLRGLEEMGMFSRLEVFEFDWFRTVPMKPERYDFDTGRWDFDWQGTGPDDFQSAAAVPSEKCRFDHVDLLIMKELQMDANKSLKEMSDKLKVNYKKLAWHYSSHVIARGLISGYTVNWMGTRYDYTLEKALHRRHRYFAVDLFARGPSELEAMSLRRGIDRLPFLWGEAGGGNYFAEFAFPVDNVVEALQYIGRVTHGVRDRMSIHPIDQSEAARFTIAYQLFDSTAKRWTFDAESLLSKFERLMVQIKAGVS